MHIQESAMSDALQQAIVAVKTGERQRARQILSEILQAEPENPLAWIWLSRAVTTAEQRRACLDRALALNPAGPEVQQALLEWLVVGDDGASVTPVTGQVSQKPPASDLAPPPADQLRPVAGTSLSDFLLQLTKNFNILKEREAKYGSAAAPLDLLNQLDDYEHAMALTQEAIDRAAPLAELQAEFASLNLEISTVVFVAQEPPRKPFMGQNPYRGLRKFTEDDARFFFGRTDAIQSLLNTVQYLVESDANRQEPDLVAVLGPSGSGKSSLVRAGLVPAIRAGQIPGSQQWPVKVMLPGPHPLDSLAETFSGEGGWDLATLRDRLRTGGEKALHELIGQTLAAAGQSEESVLVLVIDQFEELFTLCEDEAERRTFIDQLLYASQAIGNRSLIVLTMRSDFYSRVAAYKTLAETVTRQQMLVSPMTEKELREAILLPAEAVGLELEKALVETLLKDTFEAPGVLPLLQHALLELFHRRDGNLLTLEAYNEIGGVKGALAHRADGVINELTAEQQQIARRIFMRLVQPGEGSADTRRRAGFEEVITVAGDSRKVEEVVKILADANLIITGRNPETDQVMLDVSHEALIREWPLLRHWLNENREGLRIQQQLAQAAKEWDQRDRDQDSLYRGARLLEVEEWLVSNPGEINPLEHDFVEASVEARERAAREQEEQRRRELEQAQILAEEQRQRAEEQARAAARLRRQRMGLIGAGVVALLLAVTAVSFGFSARRAQAEAEQEARRALAGQLAAESRTGLEHQYDLSLLASLAAYDLLQTGQIDDTIEAKSSVLAAVSQFPSLATFLQGHASPVWALALSPDGQTVAAGNDDGEILLWDLTGGRLTDLLDGDQDWIADMAFSPDGQILASGGGDNTIILWDVDTWEQQAQLAGHEGEVISVAFSLDGRILASGDSDATIILWDVARGQPLGQPLWGHEDEIRSLAFGRVPAEDSPDSQILASGSRDGSIILWDIATGQPLGQPLWGHEEAVNGVAFSPDGQILASGSDDGSVILWDAGTGAPLGEPLEEHTDYVLDVAFSPDGQTLASSSADGTFILWDVASRQALGAPFSGHGSDVTRVRFGPDNQTLVSSSDDGSVILWNAVTGPPIARTLPAQDSGLVSLAYSPDGRVLASGDEQGTIILWDAAAGQPLQQLSGHQQRITDIAFSPDGQTLASSSLDETIKLWEIPSGQQIGEPLTGHTGPTWAVAFSPDGQTLASGGEDSRILLWDAATGQQRVEFEAGHTGAVLSLAFSPDGQILASGSVDATVILWEVAAGQPLGEPLYGHSELVYDVAFSPDGALLASISDDSTIRLWDPVTGQQVGETLRHDNSAYQLAFSPDGQTLASTSFDQTVRLWDVTTQKQIGAPLFGHDSVVEGLAFSPDGQSIASGGRNGTIFIWDITMESWRAAACHRANRNLTSAEWEQLIGPDIPYQPVCPDLPLGPTDLAAAANGN
jgi:WD40 repeat protein